MIRLGLRALLSDADFQSRWRRASDTRSNASSVVLEAFHHFFADFFLRSRKFCAEHLQHDGPSNIVVRRHACMSARVSVRPTVRPIRPVGSGRVRSRRVRSGRVRSGPSVRPCRCAHMRVWMANTCSMMAAVASSCGDHARTTVRSLLVDSIHPCAVPARCAARIALPGLHRRHAYRMGYRNTGVSMR